MNVPWRNLTGCSRGFRGANGCRGARIVGADARARCEEAYQRPAPLAVALDARFRRGTCFEGRFGFCDNHVHAGIALLR
jgi:hypothetical protein